jgi:23S rRNA pseudouridine1911/1915/1917 synthase
MEMEKPKVIFEDESLLVLDKPTGMVVNRAQTVKRETLQDWLEKKLKLQDRGVGGRAGIVHRLDKETSGILIVAKTEQAFTNLQKQFKDRKIKKSYQALAHGKIGIKRGHIKAPVGRLPWNRERFGVLPGGRPAETDYEVISYYKKDDQEFSLLNLFPKTGRTHQIRIHLKYLGYPIVSDNFYAGRKTSRKDRIWCQRLFLHAKSISFKHPKTKKVRKFESSLPADLSKALQKLTLLKS